MPPKVTATFYPAEPLPPPKGTVTLKMDQETADALLAVLGKVQFDCPTYFLYDALLHALPGPRRFRAIIAPDCLKVVRQ